MANTLAIQESFFLSWSYLLSMYPCIITKPINVPTGVVENGYHVRIGPVAPEPRVARS
jgi:hypothetical protein